MRRAALWLSVVFIPVTLTFGSILAVQLFGWWTLIVVAIVAVELLAVLHTSLSELGLQRVADKFPRAIKEAKRKRRPAP